MAAMRNMLNVDVEENLSLKVEAAHHEDLEAPFLSMTV